MDERSGIETDGRARQRAAKELLWLAAAEGREVPPETLPLICNLRFMKKLVCVAIRNGHRNAIANFVNGDVKQWLHPRDAAFLERALATRGEWLMYAAEWGSDDAVLTLLSSDAPVNYEPDDHGNTPLLYAARFGQSSTVRLLIEAKADVNGAGQNGRTAAYFAASHGDVGLLQALIGAKADVDIACGYGITPVSIAAEGMHLSVVELLGKERLGLSDQTTLAVRQGDVGEIQRLIEAKAVLRTFNAGMSHLAFAASEGQVHVVGQILAAKAAVDGLPNDRATPLFYAASKGNAPVVQLLLEAKAAPNRGMRFDSPVKMAMSKGHDAVVQLLLAAKAAV
jgi:ankyrin repeat protein